MPAAGQPGNLGIVSGAIDSFVQKLAPPEINNEHCVHARIKIASCRACVDVCHAKACVLGDGRISIDPELCDNCGICAAVCPETAIEHRHSPLSIRWQGELLALVACEKLSGDLSNQADGMLICVHALSLRDLVKLYTAGHRRLLLCTATCVECGRGPGGQLEQHLDVLNSLLMQTNEPPLERVDISAEQWSNIMRAADSTNTGKATSRRYFLHQVASEVSDYGLRKLDLGATEQAAPASIAELLFARPDGKTLPFVPKIDVRRCTACNTCIKLCPHYALTMDEIIGTTHYKIDAVNCTACGICVDVCENEAIEIERNTVLRTACLALTECKCQVCGFKFHSFDAKPAPFCSTCRQKKHNVQLFQVLA